MHDAALDEKSTNEELIDERGSIQVFSSKLQKYLQEGNFKDVIGMLYAGNVCFIFLRFLFEIR